MAPRCACVCCREAALLSGFSCPDDFVVRERTLDNYGGGDLYQASRPAGGEVASWHQPPPHSTQRYTPLTSPALPPPPLRLQGEALGTLRHGRGAFTRACGDRYVGEWRYDLREGRGKAQFASGLMYDGEWVNDKAEG